jgi:hypothetical protein
MVTAITNMQTALINLDISSFFFKYDYAYGWLFWFIYAAISFPGFILSQIFPNIQFFETIHIISNRILSTVLIFMTVYLIKRIILLMLSESTKHREIIAGLLSLLILLFPSVGYWAGRVQPSALTTFLFVLSFFLLIQYRSSSKLTFSVSNYSSKFLLNLSFLSFGALIGTKPTSIPLIPIFLVTYLIFESEKKDKNKKTRLINFLRNIGIATIGAGISASPSIIVLPLLTMRKIYETISFFSNSYNYQKVEISGVFANFYNGFIVPGIGIQGFLILITLGLLSLIRIKLRERRYLYSGIVLTSALLAILYFSLIVSENYHMIAAYLLPLIALQIIVFPILISSAHTKKIFTPLVLTLFFTVAIGYNFYQNLDAKTDRKLAINTYLLDSNSMEKQQSVSTQRRLKPEISDHRPITILQSYRSPTLLSDLRDDVQTFYSFDNWGEFTNLTQVDYILVNDSDVALLSDIQQRVYLQSHGSRSLQIIQGNRVVSRLFSKGQFSNQMCKKIKRDLNDTLFSCK